MRCALVGLDTYFVNVAMLTIKLLFKLITLHQAEETESLRDLFQLDLADDVTSESLLDSEHLSIQSLPSSKFTQSFNRGAHPYGVGSKQISSSSITLISRSSSTSWSDAVRGNKFSNHDHYHPSERPYTPDGYVRSILAA